MFCCFYPPQKGGRGGDGDAIGYKLSNHFTARKQRNSINPLHATTLTQPISHKL